MGHKTERTVLEKPLYCKLVSLSQHKLLQVKRMSSMWALSIYFQTCHIPTLDKKRLGLCWRGYQQSLKLGMWWVIVIDDSFSTVVMRTRLFFTISHSYLYHENRSRVCHFLFLLVFVIRIWHQNVNDGKNLRKTKFYSFKSLVCSSVPV